MSMGIFGAGANLENKEGLGLITRDGVSSAGAFTEAAFSAAGAAAAAAAALPNIEV